MSPDDLKFRARRLIEEVLNQGDLAVASELMSPTCVHHVPGAQLGERLVQVVDRPVHGAAGGAHEVGGVDRFLDRGDVGIEGVLDMFHVDRRGTEPFDLAGQVTENHWNGRVNVELIGLDVSFPATG